MCVCACVCVCLSLCVHTFNTTSFNYTVSTRRPMSQHVNLITDPVPFVTMATKAELGCLGHFHTATWPPSFTASRMEGLYQNLYAWGMYRKWLMGQDTGQQNSLSTRLSLMRSWLQLRVCHPRHWQKYGRRQWKTMCVLELSFCSSRGPLCIRYIALLGTLYWQRC